MSSSSSAGYTASVVKDNSHSAHKSDFTDLKAYQQIENQHLRLVWGEFSDVVRVWDSNHWFQTVFVSIAAAFVPCPFIPWPCFRCQEQCQCGVDWDPCCCLDPDSCCCKCCDGSFGGYHRPAKRVYYVYRVITDKSGQRAQQISLHLGSRAHDMPKTEFMYEMVAEDNKRANGSGAVVKFDDVTVMLDSDLQVMRTKWDSSLHDPALYWNRTANVNVNFIVNNAQAQQQQQAPKPTAPSVGRFCSSCGAVRAETAAFCAGCGTKF